jgi:hypothetical protein
MQDEISEEQRQRVLGSDPFLRQLSKSKCSSMASLMTENDREDDHANEPGLAFPSYSGTGIGNNRNIMISDIQINAFPFLLDIYEISTSFTPNSNTNGENTSTA